MSIKEIRDGVFVNTDASYMFTNPRCEECPHRVNVNADGLYPRYKCAYEFKLKHGNTFVGSNRDDIISTVRQRGYEDAFLVRDGAHDDYIMCGCCASWYGHTCEDAEPDMYFTDYIFNTTSNEYVTRRYAENNLEYCEYCDAWVEADCYDYDYGMCNDCAETRRNRIIGGWHDHKGEFKKVGASDDFFTLGIELEIDGGNGNNNALARCIDSVFPHHFVFENDCSLDTGFEIISHPHTITAWENLDLKRLCQMCLDDGYVSHDAGTCGLHVHFSTDFLGSSTDAQKHALARVLRFYEYYFETLVKLSRRGDSYSNYADRNSHEHDYAGYDIDIDDDFELVSHSVSSSRYVAVNCTNFNRYNTIEFRLARGTLRESTIRAWVDFHVCLLNACRQTSNTFPTWEAVMSMCKDSTKTAFSARLNN